jgi:hypothetical protein
MRTQGIKETSVYIPICYCKSSEDNMKGTQANSKCKEKYQKKQNNEPKKS